MLPKFLLPETVTRQDGAGTEMALGQSKLLRLTLGITRIMEQENLEVSIWGSGDREQWTQLAAFPNKSYCGNYSLLLDLNRKEGVRYLLARWKMGRWSNREPAPLFGFYLLAEEGNLQRHAGAA